MAFRETFYQNNNRKWFSLKKVNLSKPIVLISQRSKQITNSNKIDKVR